MTLDELLNDKNIKLLESSNDLMSQAFKEAAEKFSYHPSTASLTWAKNRYLKLLQESTHGN